MFMRKRRTPEEFKKEFYELADGEYELLSDFVATKEKIKIHHKKCGRKYEAPASSFLRGKRCRKCTNEIRGKSRMKSEETFTQEVFNLVGDEYRLLERYKGDRQPISILHTLCGHEYKVIPSGFLRGTRCPKCSIRYSPTDREFKDRVKKLVGNEYIFLGKYKKVAEKMKVVHTTCGYEYSVSPNGFFNGNRCPSCRLSKGEEKVRVVLEKMSVVYVREKSFQATGEKRFDFFIPKINAIIEYDGEQHYRPIEFFGGKKTFEDTQKSDRIKNEFCKRNGIELLRIPYWDFDEIESIVVGFLNENSSNEKLNYQMTLF